MDTDTIIYIIIAVVYILFGAYKNYKKQAAKTHKNLPQQSRTISTPVSSSQSPYKKVDSEESKKSKYDEILQELEKEFGMGDEVKEEINQDTFKKKPTEQSKIFSVEDTPVKNVVLDKTPEKTDKIYSVENLPREDKKNFNAYIPRKTSSFSVSTANLKKLLKDKKELKKAIVLSEIFQPKEFY